MAGLGCLKGGVRGLGVAKLADQDDVRILAEDATEGLLEARRVEPHLALVHDAVAVGVEDLDRILHGDDVLTALAVDLIEHRRERRRLARPGGAGDEDETAMLLSESRDPGRKAELVEARNHARDHAESE